MYVDGFVIPIAKKNVAVYTRIARKAGKVWKKYGAIDYKECVGDDLNIKGGVRTFIRQIKPKRGETVLFSFIVYKSRAHRDRVNAKVMKDPAIGAMMSSADDMPFDMKRMVYGGFKVIVDE